MVRFCSTAGLVCGHPSSEVASHGEQQPPATATALLSAAKSSTRKAGQEAALPDKGKGKASEMGTSVRRTSKKVAKSPKLKTPISSMKSYIAIKKGRKINILTFEVANIIAKGSNLMNFLSEDNIRKLKNVVLQNQGIKRLISDDQNQLLALVGDEIRQQFEVFAAGVVRLGNMCMGPKWHNLDKHFSGLESGLITQKYSHIKAASKMDHLMKLADQSVVLFHAMRRLQSSEQMYQEAVRKDMPVQVFQNTVEIEKQIMLDVKKKSLWPKKMERIVKKLVYIVHFLPSEINCVFYKEREADGSVNTTGSLQQTLGSADLQLHYAKIILAIKSLACVPSAVPICGVDSLFHALPDSIISGLLPRMRRHTSDDMRTEAEIFMDMSRKIELVVPMAEHTKRMAHHTGMIGDCLQTGDLSDQSKLLKIQTLYHADKMKIDELIKDMVMDLHLLIRATKRRIEISCARLANYLLESQEETGSADTGTGGSAIASIPIID
uniref:DUF3475 domain-containing protein n=1 Tax=Leersia perrieri TaxID=77586 RepID=A0A0D9XPN7_9ORYZ